MDYGKYLYQQNKRHRESKKAHAAKKVKEIKIRAKIEKHDLNFKIEHIKDFLAKNYKVKVTIIFRGREITRTELGRELIERVIKELGDGAVIESAPKMEGRILTAVLAQSTKKPKQKPVENEKKVAELTAGKPAPEDAPEE
jgi:translation initiation factor IF-3